MRFIFISLFLSFFYFSVLIRGHADGPSSGEALEASVSIGFVSFGEAATN